MCRFWFTVAFILGTYVLQSSANPCTNSACVLQSWSSGLAFIGVDLSACSTTKCPATPSSIPLMYYFGTNTTTDLCCAWSSYYLATGLTTAPSMVFVFPSMMDVTMTAGSSISRPAWGYSYPPLTVSSTPLAFSFPRTSEAPAVSYLTAQTGKPQWIEASVAMNATSPVNATAYVTFIVTPVVIGATQPMLYLECSDASYAISVLIQVGVLTAPAGAFNTSETRTMKCNLGVAVTPTFATSYRVTVTTMDVSLFPTGKMHLVTSPIAVDRVQTTSATSTRPTYNLNTSILLLCQPSTVVVSPQIKLTMATSVGGVVGPTEYNSIGFRSYDIDTSNAGGLHVNTVQYVGMYPSSVPSTFSFTTTAYFGTNAAIFKPSAVTVNPSIWTTTNVLVGGSVPSCSLPICTSTITTTTITTTGLPMTNYSFSDSSSLQSYGRYCQASVTCPAGTQDAMVFVDVTDPAALHFNDFTLPNPIAVAPGYAFLRDNIPTSNLPSFDFTSWTMTSNQAWGDVPFQYAAYPATWNLPGSITYDTNAHPYTFTQSGMAGFDASVVCLQQPRCRTKTSSVLAIADGATIVLTVNSFDAPGPFLQTEYCEWLVMCNKTYAPVLVKNELKLNVPSGQPTPVATTRSVNSTAAMVYFNINNAVGVTGTANVYIQCYKQTPLTYPPPTRLGRTRTVTRFLTPPHTHTRTSSHTPGSIVPPYGPGSPPPTTPTTPKPAPATSGPSTTPGPSTAIPVSPAPLAPGSTRAPTRAPGPTFGAKSRTVTLRTRAPYTPSQPPMTPAQRTHTKTKSLRVSRTGGGAAADSSPAVNLVTSLGLLGAALGIVVMVLGVVAGHRLYQAWRKRRRSAGNQDAMSVPLEDRTNQYRWYEDAEAVARDVEQAGLPTVDHEGLLILPHVVYDPLRQPVSSQRNNAGVVAASTLVTFTAPPRNPLSRATDL